MEILNKKELEEIIMTTIGNIGLPAERHGDFPERNLAIAVLKRGFFDAIAVNSREQQEAIDWLFADKGDCAEAWAEAWDLLTELQILRREVLKTVLSKEYYLEME